MVKNRRTALAEHRGRGCSWIHLGDATVASLRTLRDRIAFHDHDLRELLPPLQHTKCIVREHYAFLVLLFPLYDHATGTVRETELDVFMNDKMLVTVNHGNKLSALVALQDDMMNAARRELVLSQNPGEVLLGLLDRAYNATFPFLVELSRDITAVEDVLFRDYERQRTIDRVLMLKTSNARARKAMQNHRSALFTLRDGLGTFFGDPPKRHLDHVISQTTSIWNTLESQREAVNTLHETNSTLISYRVNEIMKTLTIFAVIVFPLTLLAAIFGMNTIVSMPFVNDPNGFWIILGLMIAGTLAMLGIFKAKRWL